MRTVKGDSDGVNADRVAAADQVPFGVGPGRRIEFGDRGTVRHPDVRTVEGDGDGISPDREG